MGRGKSLFFSRIDMDQTGKEYDFEFYDVPFPNVTLDFRQKYDMPASYYILLGPRECDVEHFKVAVPGAVGESGRTRARTRRTRTCRTSSSR